MTGEVKGSRSKKCLSRNKRSKPGKLTQNESDDTDSGTYTAVRSRTSDEKSGHLQKVTEVHTEDSNSDSVKSVQNKLTAGASKDHKNDVFEFCDDDDLAISNDDDESRCIEKSHGNKRKRIDSDELEPSGFQNVVSKFKRSRKALINLKQPTVCLEKCKDVDAESKKEAERKGKATERNKIETSSDQLHKVEFIADNEVPLLGNQKQKENSDNQQRVDSTFKGNIADHNNMSDDKEDCSQNQVCPVCSLKFSATDQMDVINTHINSCLDGGTGSCNRENVTSAAACEDIGEDLFFCQLCQKDLSRLNSQRRQQHINRCCDQASKTEEMPPLNTAPAPAPVQCPICGKGFKSSKTRQTHLKKCAQEYNIETNQLLEIVQRLRQEEDSSSLAAGTESQVNRASSTNSHPATNTSGVKRKRRNVKPECDLDEQTQIALALSASMDPPPPPASNVGKGGKGKGKKNKGGSELPAMLLRDDETAQRAVALRAAQVLCTQEADEEEDEISCTPALAPSRLAQNIPDYQPVGPVNKEMEDEQFADDLDSKVEKTMKSNCKGSEDDTMDVDGGNDSDNNKESSKESVECTAIVDPLLSRSFLNSLYDDEVEESQTAEIKATGPIRLWSLAATSKEQSSASFYVPGLLPPASPKRSPKPPKQRTLSKLSATDKNAQNESHKQVTDIAVNKEIASHVTSERTEESVAQLQASTSENDEYPEITPTQANVQLLLELAGDDDITNMSMDSQQVTAASGFWVDEQEEEDKESYAVPSGVSKLLQDLSSMINNSHLSNVVISLKDGQEMAAHSFILSLRSEVLAQLLEEQKALQKETASGGRTDQVYLKFEEIDQSAFKVLLKHIYTGDVIIPEDCELDDVTDLAERFKLPCLLKACKKAQSRLKQVTDSQEDDDTDLCIATDVEKLEENLWKNDNDDDEDCQTTKDKEDEFEDDFLDDDDIEEIMIFQTQSLQRKASQSTGSERKDSEELLSPGAGEEISIIENKKVEFGDNLSRKESCFATPEKTEQELGERSLSRFPVEENNVSLNCLEKDNLSRSPVDKGCVSRNPTEESNLSRNSHENDENSAEEEEDDELIMSCVKENTFQEDAVVKNEQHPLGEECVEMKHFRKESDDHEEVQLLSRDDNKISHVCVRVDEPISDSDDIEAQPEDHVQEICKGRAFGGDLNQSCAVDENLADLEEDELENDADFNVSADLLDDEEERRYVDVTEHVSGEIQDNNENKNLNYHAESNNEVPDKTLPLPSEEVRWDDNDEFFQGSPGEVIVPGNVESDDEMEEMPPDESITLISDNEEEALDLYVSPPKTDVTIIPETPRARERSSTKSSSTFLVSEEDDISVTGSSPSKSRKQLNEEASEFLSKLTQRAERGKGKRQGKNKSKKSNGAKKSPVESTAKQTSPRNNSSRKNMDARVGTLPSKTRGSKQDSSSLSNSPMRMSPKGCKSPSASQMRMSPRGCKSPSDSPVRMTSRDCKSPSNSPMRMSPRGYNSPSDVTLQTSTRSSKSARGSPMPKSPRGNKSPRGLNPRSLSPVVESDVPVVTIDNSPPVSPGLLQSRESPHNSQTKRKEGEKMEDLCGRQTLDEKEADFGDPDDVEIVETCADNTEADVYGDLALSTTSSPRDVMSPPVPSPSYSFLEHLSSPGSPSPYASPQKSALSPGPVSPSLPVDWKSPSPERKLGSCPQPNSPVSPSVCSYSSQVARDLCPQDKKKDAVKNLEKKFEENFEEKEKSRNAEVVEIDPNVPLMERLKAKRGGGHKMFSLGKEEDSNSDDCCAKNEVKEDEKESAMASSQPEKVTNTQHEMNEMENISMGDDFDFYDDGGFNFDLEELNNLEGCTGDDNNVKANEDCHSKKEKNKDKPVPQKKGRKIKECHSNEEEDKNKVVPQKKGSNKVAGKRKIPPSQRRVEDSDDDDKPQEAPPKRGKKADTQSNKTAGQAVTQPVTPMPNYNQMATPVLKVELNKFGVRPLPKKKMILKLKEIYDYTHQVKSATQESQTERAPSKGKPKASNVAVSDAAEKVDGSGTASSDNNSDEEDAEFGDCTVMIEDDVITASQQVNGNNLKERLLYYLQSNEDLYSKILRYQPIELMLLHQQIKSHGINCSLGKLVDFLDQQCITFTTAGSRPRATRKRGRKKKGDNAKPSK